MQTSADLKGPERVVVDRLISEKQCQQLMDLASVSVLCLVLFVLFCLLEFVFLCCFFNSRIFTHIHIHTCTHVHTHSHIHTCTHAHTHIYTHAHMHTHMHTFTHSHPHTQYGSEGDGYSQKSPHTTREKFEGLNILEAAKVLTLHYKHCKIAVHIALFSIFIFCKQSKLGRGVCI